jgi:predicted DNA-binding transcriptional regulator AlpA
MAKRMRAGKPVTNSATDESVKRSWKPVRPVMPQGWDGPQFLSPSNVCAICGLSWPTIKRLRRARKFPDPVAISANRKGFLREHVEQWIAERAAAHEALQQAAAV